MVRKPAWFHAASGKEVVPALPLRSDGMTSTASVGSPASPRASPRSGRRSAGGLLNGLLNLLTPRSADARAALTIQKYARAYLVRRYLKTHRVLRVLSQQERRAALIIQQRWLAKVHKRRTKAALTMQSHLRGAKERRLYLSERRASAQAAAAAAARKAAVKARLLNECAAIVEKRARCVARRPAAASLWGA